MKTGFLKLLESIKTYSSYYFAVVSVLGVVWGVFVAYDNWKDNNKILQSSVKTIIQSQESQRKTDSLLLFQQVEMKRQLESIRGTTESLEDSYVKYLTRDKTLTKEDFVEYMEGLNLDVKKNSSGYQTSEK